MDHANFRYAVYVDGTQRRYRNFGALETDMSCGYTAKNRSIRKLTVETVSASINAWQDPAVTIIRTVLQMHQTVQRYVQPRWIFHLQSTVDRRQV